MTTNNRWDESHIPDQTGRVAIVTGANSGIGYETARALVQHGATVILACRDDQKAQVDISISCRTPSIPQTSRLASS